MKHTILILFITISTFAFADDHNHLADDTLQKITLSPEKPADLLISAGLRKQRNITRSLIAGPTVAGIIYVGVTTSAGILMPLGVAIGAAVSIYQIVESYKIARDLRRAGELFNRASSGTGS